MLSLRAFLSLTLVAAALAGTCYKAEKKAAAGLASLNKTLQSATFNATACKTSIDALCTTNEAKGSDCATYCALASFTFSGMVGCTSDSQCPSTTTEPKVALCCSSMRTAYSNVCEFSSAALDTMIASSKADGGCADTTAAVATTPVSKVSSAAMGSAPTSFATVLLAVVASLTASKI
ncbi:hypothetical protein GUITHDRAFT_120050 [Guillardia theta CCMP2712]|uniref:Kazal-like domain-containing protein n=1 Tax=Guillardia theta (strain CCMP2712) TaxID=905079 RepID=L1ICJ6_GUITC|nr:hypothetical protein GUITHDRAFT_120050 [Guillardia theta CCMP2712]EKX33782.1 hypothetical protein GUITHDRAFT_120050 [Guillardia theta CCMP2712]|eukprot:XP_005820762.1 hypothetical protein GUITHDRAFT_120050 [Guillardia theta CCMP2712]